jgi:hypothetical protein
MLARWQLAAGIQLLKLQHLQNEFVRTVGKHSGCTTARELLTAFQVPCIYDCIMKLRRQRAEFVQNPEDVDVRDIGNG